MARKTHKVAQYKNHWQGSMLSISPLLFDLEFPTHRLFALNSDALCLPTVFTLKIQVLWSRSSQLLTVLLSYQSTRRSLGLNTSEVHLVTVIIRWSSGMSKWGLYICGVILQALLRGKGKLQHRLLGHNFVDFFWSKICGKVSLQLLKFRQISWVELRHVWVQGYMKLWFIFPLKGTYLVFPKVSRYSLVGRYLIDFHSKTLEKFLGSKHAHLKWAHT